MQTLLGLFGQDVAQADAMRQSTGDVSQQGEVLRGPGGPFDDEILATIGHPDGTQEQAALSPGEYVLDVPTVADLGMGDIELGGAMLKTLQENPDARAAVRDTLAQFIQ